MLAHTPSSPVPRRLGTSTSARGELFGRFRKTTDEIVRLRSEFTVTLRNGFDGCTDSGRSDVTTHTTRWRVISLNGYRTRAWRRHGRTNRRAGNALVSQGERENTQLLGFNRFSKCLACVCEEYGISLKVESEAWTCQACPDCGDHEKTIRHKDTLTCLCGPEENANLRPSETLLREHSETELRPMARPVRFELDDRDWSERPHPHESPRKVRTSPQIAFVESAYPTTNGAIPALQRGRMSIITHRFPCWCPTVRICNFFDFRPLEFPNLCRSTGCPLKKLTLKLGSNN
jgi:hypothetical protein